MRKIGTAIVLLVWMYSCQQVPATESWAPHKVTHRTNAAITTAEPVVKEYNFGSLRSGDSLEYIFQVKNTGTKPLIIENVKASCGCTMVDWMKAPVPTGKTGWIKSRLKGVDKGRIKKSVVAQLNTADHFMVFYLAGEVRDNSNPLIK